ncbi:NADAR family protein [Nocardia nova]|nr:NADAR family protein [Nocardia nova]
MSVNVIDRFEGQHRYLSNFSDFPAAYRDRWYPTAEHAFAAAKTTDPQWIARIADAPSPGAAKQLGRRVPLRPDWETIKTQVMREVVASKFARTPALADRLRATGDTLLVEGNTWGDKFWGRVPNWGTRTLMGCNMLGRTLMAVRSELHGYPATRWPRAALTGHREKLIAPELRDWLNSELRRLAVKLRDDHQTHTGSSGLATGSDTWWAGAVLDAGLALWAYQPFPQQADRWTQTQRREHARLRDRAERLVVVGDGYSNGNFDLRNELLIGDANVVVAVRDPAITRGGTVSALRRYCIGMPVITINVRTRRTTISTAFRPHP